MQASDCIFSLPRGQKIFDFLGVETDPGRFVIHSLGRVIPGHGSWLSYKISGNRMSEAPTVVPGLRTIRFAMYFGRSTRTSQLRSDSIATLQVYQDRPEPSGAGPCQTLINPRKIRALGPPLILLRISVAAQARPGARQTDHGGINSRHGRPLSWRNMPGSTGCGTVAALYRAR